MWNNVNTWIDDVRNSVLNVADSTFVVCRPASKEEKQIYRRALSIHVELSTG